MGKSRTQGDIVNRTAMILFTILTSIISIAYIIQFIKGEAGWGLFLPVEILDLVPMILGWIFYKRDPETPLVKHVIGIGYGIFYLVLCMISTNTVLVFVYAIPTLILTGMFNDLRLSITSSVGVSIIATIHAIKFASMRQWEGGAVADLEIEVLIMIICSLFSFTVNRVIARNNDAKVEEINEAGEKTNVMMDSIMSISGELIDDVAQVSDKMNQLDLQATLDSVNVTISSVHAMMEQIQNPNGTLGKLMSDPSVYDNLNHTVQSADSLVTDLKANPKRYVHFSVFGRKDK